MKFKKTIAIVNDELLVRQGLVRMFNDYQNIEILFEADNGKELLEKLKVRKPEVILLDTKILEGVEVIETIKQRYPDIKMVIITSDDSNEKICELIEAGASAYVTRKKGIKVIIKVINEVIEKGFYFDFDISKALAEGLSGKRKLKGNDPVKFSTRELEVAKLILKEHTTPEIAEMLCLSKRTIETYRDSMMAKTGSRNFIGVTKYFFRHNILELSSL